MSMSSEMHWTIRPCRKGNATAQHAHDGGKRVTAGHLHGAQANHLYMRQKMGEADGVEYDFTHKREVAECEFFLPDGTQQRDADDFWRDVDQHRTRKPDAVITNVGDCSIPRDLSEEGQRRLRNQYGQWMANRWGTGVEVSFHDKLDNPHIHWQQSRRVVRPDGSLGNVNRDLDAYAATREETRPGYERNRREAPAIEMRAKWAELCNAELAREGHTLRYDPRSFKDRGIDRKPTRHIGREEARRQRQRMKLAYERPCMTVADTRKRLEEMRQVQRQRIDIRLSNIREIQDARRLPENGQAVLNRIGGISEWQDDTAGAFKRAWASADRADKIRRAIRLHSRMHVALRDPTTEEAKQLRSQTRLLRRAQKAERAIDRVDKRLQQWRPNMILDIEKDRIKKNKLSDIDNAIDNIILRPRMKMGS